MISCCGAIFFSCFTQHFSFAFKTNTRKTEIVKRVRTPLTFFTRINFYHMYFYAHFFLIRLCARAFIFRLDTRRRRARCTGQWCGLFSAFCVSGVKLCVSGLGLGRQASNNKTLRQGYHRKQAAPMTGEYLTPFTPFLHSEMSNSV